jgi:hypothetical protein
MSLPELLFTIGNIAIVPFWVLMILAPRWGWTERIMQSLWPVIVLAALYVLSLLSTAFVGESVDMSQLTLDVHGIAYLLGSPVGAATAWLHLIAFDLFVGRWIYLDSRPRSLPCLDGLNYPVFRLLHRPIRSAALSHAALFSNQILIDA